uniref:Uncharacterized protein n=1 Tax=Anguilla anguilla TaxID=7936 RepID=A0A0E9UA36_ANGAN
MLTRGVNVQAVLRWGFNIKQWRSTINLVCARSQYTLSAIIIIIGTTIFIFSVESEMYRACMGSRY